MLDVRPIKLSDQTFNFDDGRLRSGFRIAIALPTSALPLAGLTLVSLVMSAAEREGGRVPLVGPGGRGSAFLLFGGLCYRGGGSAGGSAAKSKILLQGGWDPSRGDL